ncbi:uncharacterized protein LOC144750490 [Ciona intestinalis]
MGKLNPKKMKVAELKVELESRNIEVGKGMKKADLVALLLSSIESDENVSTNDDSMFSEEESHESELNTTSEVADAEPEVTQPEQTVETDQSGESEPTQESNLSEEQASGESRFWGFPIHNMLNIVFVFNLMRRGCMKSTYTLLIIKFGAMVVFI